MTTGDYIRLNEERLQKNRQPYDPITGTEFSPEIKRSLLEIPDAPIPVQYIPVEMEKENIVRLIRKKKTLLQTGKAVFGGQITESKAIKVWLLLMQKRNKHDFEFFAATQIEITHKTEGRIVPFVLNRAQRIYLVELEKLRKSGKPIDIILLKARQWGGSTLTIFYSFWIQMMWKTNWNSALCADVDDQAKNVLGMLSQAIERYDTFITGGIPLKFTPYMRTDSTRVIEGRNCTISVGSAQHPEKIRSQNISMAHLTEVGIWKATLSKKPEDLVQSIFGSIVSAPYTMKVLESTAKGTGNYFHRTWLAASNKKNNFTPVFIPWYVIDMYQETIENYEEFICSMNGYEQMLFEKGATLEAIKWYRSKSIEFPEHWRMCSEYPTTADEAFQSTGHNFYPVEYVEELRKGCTEPETIGEITANERKGKEAFEGIRIFSQTNGNLKIWKMPDNETKMSNRYLVVVDIGGRSEKADNSVICVFDRYWQHEVGGIPEIAAEWCGHIEIDLLAWKAAQIAMSYSNALLVVESNTLETKGTEGNHFNTLLSEIAEYYPNMYRRTKEEQLVKGGTVRYGFHTNTLTKTMVCDHQLEVIRDGLYIERCMEAVDEHKTFEVKADGSLGAVDGCHDDRHITRAIGNYFCYKVMPVPQFLTGTNTKFTASKKIINEYSI